MTLGLALLFAGAVGFCGFCLGHIVACAQAARRVRRQREALNR